MLTQKADKLESLYAISTIINCGDVIRCDKSKKRGQGLGDKL